MGVLGVLIGEVPRYLTRILRNSVEFSVVQTWKIQHQPFLSWVQRMYVFEADQSFELSVIDIPLRLCDMSEEKEDD